MAFRRAHHRRGAVTLEFAVVAPLVFLFFFGAVELERANMLRHTLEIAAYEGARRGIVPGATASDVNARASQILATVGARNATITVTPDPITPSSERVTVEIAVPFVNNSWMPPKYLKAAQLRGAFSLGRENVGWSSS